MSESAAPATEAPATDPASAPETFSREYVEGLRGEAAKYRNEKKDAVDAAKAEAVAEAVAEYEPKVAERDTQISTLTADLAAATTDNLKLRAVLGSEGVATGDVLSLVELVQGTDEESISESVKRVLAVYGKKDTSSPAYDPTIGSGNGGAVPPLNGDPVLNLLRRAVGAK